MSAEASKIHAGKILVAGGAGYIGSHTCVNLLELGYEVVVVDSLRNGRISNLRRVEQITGRNLDFVEVDLRDLAALNRIFSCHQISAVINFAGYKAVAESVQQPLDYYDNNLNCAITLLECMDQNGVRTLVFSSSAAVYGEPDALPVTETAATRPRSPYGKTKLYIEEMLRDVARADDSWKFAILRYFNPVGAHPSGLIGEQPSGIPNSLMPLLCRVAAGEQSKLSIFGNDYDTPDGTAIRDYIHVTDLAGGHGKALEKLRTTDLDRVLTVNLGTGRGYSVMEMLRAFERTCGHRLAFEFTSRRAGDMACCYADPELARRVLHWEANLDIEQMCRDAWNWHQKSSGNFQQRTRRQETNPASAKP